MESSREVTNPAYRRFVKPLIVLALLVSIPVVIGNVYPDLLQSSSAPQASDAGKEQTEPLPVTTIKPVKKTLTRSLVQPGTVEAWAQAELYAKASGYVEAIQVEVTARNAAELLAAGFQSSGHFDAAPVVAALPAGLAFKHGFEYAPEKQIGSRVHRGELLLEIHSPERSQQVAELKAIYEQRLAELDQARSTLASFEAAIRAVEAQQLEVEADIKSRAAEAEFARKQLQRLRALVARQAINEEIAEEKQSHLEAARAAHDAAVARRAAVAAEHAQATARLGTARAEVKVKDALVKVALEEWRNAQIGEDYTRLHAPFDGIITSRSVDIGDFVQNSTSSQTRRLLTVTSLDKVKVVLHVPSREAVSIKPGARALVHLDSLPEHQSVGYVARTSSNLDPDSRTLRVEIDLDNRHHRLMPGMYGQVEVSLEEIPDIWTVPASAVYSSRGRNYILSVQDGVAQRLPVQILFDNGRELRVAKLIDSKQVRCDGSEELIVSNKGEIADGQHVLPSLLIQDQPRALVKR
ncbi:MAG: efflux RND transporter periplasmic adaptor subunit [Gemmataceae bacterium]